MAVSLPFIKWREGRPRFCAGPRERDLGFRDQDLRHESGRWFTYEEAEAWATARHAEILAARTAGKRPRPIAPKRTTVEELLRDWMASRQFADLMPSSRSSYRKAADALIYEPETRAQAAERRAKERASALLKVKPPERSKEALARTPVAAIGAPELNDFFEYLRERRGHHMARAAIAAYSAAFTWGKISSEWRLKGNPRAELNLPQPKARVVIFTDAEIRALVDTADGMGRASLGDAILLGLFTGQRQGDRLALEDLGLIEGRRQFRQSKTGAIVAIPETPRLAERLAQAKARVAAIKLQSGLREATRTIIVDETTGRSYVGDTYRHVYSEVRAKAAELVPELAGKRDQDLRDTAVTWLARAGCTLPEIASITGHSLASIHNILKHYLAITPELADSAISKLIAWMGREGMAV